MLTPLVSVAWLAAHLHDPELIVLDASLPTYPSGKVSDFPGQQIPGSRPFDMKGTFADRESVLPNMIPQAEAFTDACQALGIHADSKIVVFDNLNAYASPRAWWMFRVMGHEAVAVLDGGLPAWIQAGHAVEATAADKSYPRGDFVAHYHGALVRNANDLLENLQQPQEIVLDARSQGRFVGQAPEPHAGLKGGHIPQSINLPYSKVIRDGHFLPPQELEGVFASLSLGQSPLVFTCGSGITACIILLASELVLDNPKALYAGSSSDSGSAGEEIPEGT